MVHYRSLFISDTHLGARSSKVTRLLAFLKDIRADSLYLVGDIVDGKTIPQKAVRALLGVSANVTYVFGNHDFLGALGAIVSVSHAFHETADGRKLLIVHGDQFDPLMNGWYILFSGMQQNLLWRFVYHKFVKKARAAALTQGCSGVICGHIHHPEIRQKCGFLYANCGDFVTSCTAIAEHHDGYLDLLRG